MSLLDMLLAIRKVRCSVGYIFKTLKCPTPMNVGLLFVLNSEGQLLIIKTETKT